jgi:hypothetical protein
MRQLFLTLALALGSACSSEPAVANATDASVEQTDTFTQPAETAEPSDTALVREADVATDSADAPAKFDILGTLAGECGGLVAELTKPTSTLQTNSVAYVMGEKYAKESMSVPDGQRIFEAANAGGSSGESEVMSFEILHYCDDAALVKTETEITYAPPDDAGANSITDILVSIGGKKVGVSVTRAYKPPPLMMSDTEVKDLLEKKFDGINRSSVRVLPADKWVKQILHVFVADANMEAAVKRVLPSISAAKRADTIVVLTRTAGGGFIYCNPDPPLGSECPPI